MEIKLTVNNRMIAALFVALVAWVISNLTTSQRKTAHKFDEMMFTPSPPPKEGDLLHDMHQRNSFGRRAARSIKQARNFSQPDYTPGDSTAELWMKTMQYVNQESAKREGQYSVSQ